MPARWLHSCATTNGRSNGSTPPATSVSRKYGSVMPSTPARRKYQSSIVCLGRPGTTVARDAGVADRAREGPLEVRVDGAGFRPARRVRRDVKLVQSIHRETPRGGGGAGGDRRRVVRHRLAQMRTPVVQSPEQRRTPDITPRTRSPCARRSARRRDAGGTRETDRARRARSTQPRSRRRTDRRVRRARDWRLR